MVAQFLSLVHSFVGVGYCRFATLLSHTDDPPIAGPPIAGIVWILKYY